MSMRVGSFCTGIAAPERAWSALGWQPQWFSEIDPFACAVLAHHYPTVPNLGDMTQLNETEIPDVDVVVAGTPCQSFSVAGLRGGMADPRGNLALVLLGLVDRIRPRWLVWENVPGFLSVDGGQAARDFLDAIEALGYVVDIDILDAQFFDVPQRRRRIFICAEKAESILRQTTLSSALTICQCVLESLHLALVVLSDQSIADSENFGFDVSEPRHSLLRRIELFGLHKAEAASMLQSKLDVLQQSCECAPADSDSRRGRNGTWDSKNIADTRSRASIAATECFRGECRNTDTSLRNVLDDAFAVLREFTTSTSTSATTESRIYFCARAFLRIAAIITQSMDWSPSFWSAASSALIGVKGFIEHARSATSNLFANLEWVQPWCDFLRQAEPAIIALANLRVGNFGKILPISNCLSGDSAPSRETGQRIARSVKGGTRGGGGQSSSVGQETLVGVTNFGEQDTSTCLTGKQQRIDPDTETFVVHSLRADGFDASEDGTGRGTPIIPIDMRQASRGATMTNNRGPDVASGGAPGTGIGEAGDPAPSLADTHTPAVAYQCHGTNDEARHTPHLTVRRLLPIECERLMGLPDNYTLVPYRGKPASDGPRYRAIGISMAVPVLRWIGERIELVELYVAPAPASPTRRVRRMREARA